MKKALLLLLCCLLLVAAVAACQTSSPPEEPTPSPDADTDQPPADGASTDDPTPETPQDPAPADGPPRSADYAALLQSGRYFIHYSREFQIEGESFFWEVQVGVDGDDYLTETHRDDGYVVLHLTQDGEVYYIDPAAKTAQHMSFMESRPAGGVPFANMTYVGSQTVEFIDQPYDGEIWSDGTRQVIFYLIEDDNLRHLHDGAGSDNAVMLRVFELSAEIPTRLQAVPEDYQWLD